MTLKSHINRAGQLAFPLGGNDKASFDNYLHGQNTELVNAIKASVRGLDTSLLYFYGPHNSGKSHLMFAALSLAKIEGIDASYVSLSDNYVAPEMLSVIDMSSLVLVDNADAWAGDRDKERALFTLFEQIKHAGGQLLISASQMSEAAGFAIPDLVSRLSSGLIYAVTALSEEQQFDALKMRASHRGLSISDEAMKYLLTRMTRDTGEIFELLERIDHASLAEQRRVTIPFLQSLLQRD
jgi:DnaA family protein